MALPAIQWVTVPGPDRHSERVDRRNEILFVPESSSCVFHPLDFGVERFADRVANPML